MKLPAKLFARLCFTRKRAYDATFRDPNTGDIHKQGDVILADLKEFCRAETSTFAKNDPYQMALLEGRREVWMRIQSHLNMTDAEIRQLKQFEEN